MASWLRWTLLSVAIFALILVPFLLFGEQVEAWTEDFVHQATDRPLLVGTVLGSLLAVDILAPIPSSLVSTASGFTLGFWRGTLASTLGMVVSCVVGYWLGARLGRPAAARLVGESELARLERLSPRLGDWVIVVSRPVPMLAEAAVLFAGLGRMPFPRFMLLSTLSNLGISATYAAVGAFSATINSFLLAFAGSVLLPAVAMYLARGKSETEAPMDAATEARMDATQLQVMNSRLRQWFQKHYEFRVIEKQLRRHNIDLRGKVVLDAGCGSGYSTEVISEMFRPGEVWAFDLMPQQIELARQRGLDAHLFVGDIAAIEQPDAKFDAVFTFGVFHHVPEWPRALSEVYRVLKPGGVLLGGEIKKEPALGFEWEAFAVDVEEAGFRLVESQKIYLGYFYSFVAVKPE